MLLKGKNIVITGAGRGIGRYVAIACAKEGANLGLMARTLEQLNSVKKEIDDLKIEDVKVLIHPTDVSKYEDLEIGFNTFANELGLINGVIANAGLTRRGNTHEMTVERFRYVIDVNLNGVFFTFKAAYPHLDLSNKKDKARFIITGSQSGINAMPYFTAYSASKHAVIGFQKGVAIEYKQKNINFNQILPQFVDTRISRGDDAESGDKPEGYLDPWDLNEYYLFYLFPESNRINNEIIPTMPLQEAKGIYNTAPAEKKENWEIFKRYLSEVNQKLYSDIKKFSKNFKILKFLLHI